MVIELSGVRFGLKSYAWFQNRTSGITSMTLNQTCKTRSSIATLFDPFWNRTILSPFPTGIRIQHHFVKNRGTRNTFTSHLVCKETHSKTHVRPHPSITKEVWTSEHTSFDIRTEVAAPAVQQFLGSSVPQFLSSTVSQFHGGELLPQSRGGHIQIRTPGLQIVLNCS